MGKIVKLGENASTFVDIRTGFNISGIEVKELSKSQAASKKTASALRNGHIVVASKDELEEYEAKAAKAATKQAIPEDSTELKKALKAEKTSSAAKDAEIEELKAKLQKAEEADGGGNGEGNNFEDMTKAELTEYYKENFEVSEDDLEAFKSKNKPDMVKELEDLEEEAEDTE